MLVLDFTGNKICPCSTHIHAFPDRAYHHWYGRSFISPAGSYANVKPLVDQQWGCKGASFTPTLHVALKRRAEWGVSRHQTDFGQIETGMVNSATATKPFYTRSVTGVV